MRTFVLICSLLLSATAHGADSLLVAQQLYQTGTPHLALARVVRDQPASADAPQWPEWESLRLSLLFQLGRPEELLARVKQAPEKAPREFLQKAYGHAAWAHLERGEGAAARVYLARLLWRFPLSSADHRWARRLVIRSWLVEHKPDEAYRAMLRYQQDFAPLGRDVAAEFVQGLLSERRATEAMTWLGELDPASATALGLRLKLGLVAPDAAIAQARDALAAQPAATGYARVIAEAAEMTGDRRLRVEALEQMLAGEAVSAETAAQLWRAYLAQAEAAGNRAQLLQGDDASWLAMAAGLSAADPLEGRAVHAYLVERGSGADARELALTRLFAGLVNARLEQAAVRLLTAAPWGGEKPSVAAVGRLAQRAAEAVPAAEARALMMAAGQFAESRGSHNVAADHYVQAVLASDMGAPDLTATQALKAAIDNLERAGFKEDATAFYRRMVALRAPTQKAAEKPGPKTASPKAEPKREPRGQKGKRK